MTRCSNRIGFLTGLFLLLCSTLQAQDLYDVEHSKIYAKHLYEDGRYAWAADEYGRLIQIKPDDSLKILFLRSHRMSRQWENSYTSVKEVLSDIPNQNQGVIEEYLKLMLSGGYFRETDIVLGQVDIRLDKYKFQELLLQKNWKEATAMFPQKKEFAPEAADSQYSILLNRAAQLPHRSPTLAATMSVVIPGAGKVYCGEWKDALISFFFVAFSTYESVNAFKIAGPGSYMGYIYGGLAAGFYGGGVYGSYKSAKRFNTRQNEMILDDAKAIIFSTY